MRDEDITLLCGIGHAPALNTPEKRTKLGAEVVARYRVIDNEPQNPAALVDLGVTPGGVPVRVHRAAVEADLLIATGIVEPHQYAGYSGGGKTVAVGRGGRRPDCIHPWPSLCRSPRHAAGPHRGQPVPSGHHGGSSARRPATSSSTSSWMMTNTSCG